MLTFILLAVWVLIFAPLVIVPLLPNGGGPRAVHTPHTVAENKVVMLAARHTEHAA